MHIEWVRNIRNQCKAARVPFFFKQWSEWIAGGDNLSAVMPIQDNLECHLFYDLYQSFRVGKKVAGRSLDNRTYDEYPSIVP